MSKDLGINEPGRCPKCGDCNLSYETNIDDSYSIYYPYTCDDCGATGKEWYSKIFDKQELDENC
ncbi:hypothetical protein LCGC14_2891960 [marine sediment metagenome]|uniref:Uncharacterized protein n=1 Tax=marine sediment metagenome TaxID=412755 RepID=A0A0F8XXA5_9ZZZZ